MLLPFLLLTHAVASAAPTPISRLEDLARSIKYAASSVPQANHRSSYCSAVEAEGRLIARGGEEVKWILTEHADSVRLSLGSIDVDELLEGMTDQVAFDSYLEDGLELDSAEGDLERDDVDDPSGEGEGQLDASRLHPSFHAYVSHAEGAFSALTSHLASSSPCSFWKSLLGRCPTVELTGHGLGGALALLISEQLPQAHTVTTFGMPPLIDEPPRHENWVNGLDPVSHFLEGGERLYMTGTAKGFSMNRAKLEDHHSVHGVRFEC